MTWCQGPGLCPGGGWVLEGPVQLGSQKGAGRPSATAAIEGRRRATHDKGALFIPRMCLPHLKVKREDVDCRSRWPCPYRHVPRIHVAVGMVPPYPRLWVVHDKANAPTQGQDMCRVGPHLDSSDSSAFPRTPPRTQAPAPAPHVSPSCALRAIFHLPGDRWGVTFPAAPAPPPAAPPALSGPPSPSQQQPP